MKKLFVISACLFGMFSCQRMEEVLESHVVEFEVVDVHEDDTRIYHDFAANKAIWEHKDVIGCFAESNSNIAFSNSAEDPTTFSGSILGEPSVYRFYFPYDASASAQGTVVTSSLPSNQLLETGRYGTPPPMTAQSTDPSTQGVAFHNACGVIRFTVKSNNDRVLVKATFAGNNNEAVAGTYTMDMASETPKMEIIGDAKTTLTMTGNVEMEAEKQYPFIVSLPPTNFEEGFTITLTDANGAEMSKTFTKALNLTRNLDVNVEEVLYFDVEAPVSQTVLEMSSLKASGITFTIDEENLTAKASKTGYTNPKSLSLSMTYIAHVDGENVTPEITLTRKAIEDKDDNGDWIYAVKNTTITDHTAFNADLTMPNEITLSYGNVSKTYTVKLSQLTDSGLPVVYINTSTGNDVPVNDKDTWIENSEIYIDAEGRNTFEGSALEDLVTNVCSVKGRGNTTWSWVKDTEGLYANGAKRPYAIKLNEKSEVLGMAKHKRWVLLNNFADKALIRNYFAFMLANAFADAEGGSGEWHPTGQPVEVVVNGIHRGNYLLCEQIKLDAKRVKGTEYDKDITITTGEEISYLLEGDRNWGHTETGDPTETLYWESYRESTNWKQSSNGSYIYGTNYTNGSYSDGTKTYKFRWGLKSPDDGDLGSAAAGKATVPYTFINKQVTKVEQFLFTNTFTTKTLDDISEYINLDSFIEYWLTYELTLNHEPNNPGSCYMHYYDGDGKLYMGPVWDFDFGTYSLSFNDGGLYGNKYKHFLIANSLWYCRLLQNTNVQNYISERWPVYKAAAEATIAKISSIKQYQTTSSKYNFKSESSYGLWNIDKDPNSENSTKYSTAVDNISSALTSRVEQLDELINNKRYY